MFYSQSITGLPLKSANAERVVASKRKRILDIVLAASALFFFLPLLVLVAAAIRVESRGPALFRQQRGGLNGEIFTILKFRTMRQHDNSEPVKQATRDDPRVTRLGAFLRRSSLDELPQLLNVLRGEMSIVGPRPHALDHDKYYGELFPHYRLRATVKPGLTGLAQIEGYRGETAEAHQMAQRVARDIQYIERWNFIFDLNLILRSTLVPFGVRAAY